MAFTNLGAASRFHIEQAVNQCQDYAHKNIYVGALTGGEIYSGWPIDDLVDATFPNGTTPFKAIVATTLKNRWSARGLFSGSHVGGFGPPQARPSNPPNPPSFPSNREMLKMRMRWQNWGEGFEHIDVHQQGDKVHIWIIANDGQSIVLEDEGPLFPSDAIVTKLNMIKGA